MKIMNLLLLHLENAALKVSFWWLSFFCGAANPTVSPKEKKNTALMTYFKMLGKHINLQLMACML